MLLPSPQDQIGVVTTLLCSSNAFTYLVNWCDIKIAKDTNITIIFLKQVLQNIILSVMEKEIY